jgi:hypothetical protein
MVGARPAGDVPNPPKKAEHRANVSVSRQNATQFLTVSTHLFVILRAITGSHFVWANEYET